ncbi:DUF956 family protein [Vagococcus vulneris]|uniref:DUF956 domain-containing protein n=1 Tax=Vagococcus vulneris TaxID=1977869 RepID=A0A429ZYQ1_9ENTE|nr:DUF956 family protein [Vagococcus vulneris]RST99111.1 hypothetical protein CBF37_05445 [Vagococcus vulneris]
MVESLNQEVDVAVKANAFLNPVNPKTGIMAIGDKGVEFRETDGAGYVQVPWQNIVQVRAQVYLKGKYIRSFDIVTDANQSLNFVTTDAIDALKAMRKHLTKEQMIQAPGNFKRLFKFGKKK